jgi:hypothetical protein
MRMVADLSDPDKVEAHIPGGATHRLFHPRFKDQLPDWLSDDAIEPKAVSELMRTPNASSGK